MLRVMLPSLDLKVDDLQFDDLDAQDANIVGFVTVGGGAASLGGQTHLHVIGISSMQNLRVVGFTTLGSGGSDEDGQTHLHVIGITSTKNLDVTGFARFIINSVPEQQSPLT